METRIPFSKTKFFLLYTAMSPLVVEIENLGQQPSYVWFVVSSVGHMRLLSLAELPSVLFLSAISLFTELGLNRDFSFFFFFPQHH